MRYTITSEEEKALLIRVLKDVKYWVSRIENPDHQMIDLMLLPTCIDEAIELLEQGSLDEKALLMMYPEVCHLTS